MKKIMPFLLGTAVLLSSCGAGAQNSSSSSGYKDYGGSSGSSFSSSDMSQPESFQVESENFSGSSPEREEETTTFLSQSELQPAKLVYRGWMELETTEFDQVIKEIDAMVKKMGGYYSNQDLYHYGNSRNLSYTVRVPWEQYETLRAEVGTLCQVLHSSTTVEDISAEYYDSQGRLETQQAKMARLQEMIAMAETMEDLITLESAISDTQWMIDNLSGQMKQYDSLVDYATLDIHLSEVYQLSELEEPPDTFIQRIISSFSRGGTAFLNRTADYIVYLAYNWVVLLFWGLVIVVILIFMKKKKFHKLGKLRKKKKISEE